MRNSIVLPVEGRFTFSTNVVPASPRSRELTSLTVLSVIVESSMLSMMSPFFSPTSAAGLPA